MSFFIQYNNDDIPNKDYPELFIFMSIDKIKVEDLEEEICRNMFTEQNLFFYDAIQESSFIIYKKINEKITGGLCVKIFQISEIIYWEISLICVVKSEKGTGDLLLKKLINIAKQYIPPFFDNKLILYGIDTTPESTKLFERNGFDGNQLIIEHSFKRASVMKSKKKYIKSLDRKSINRKSINRKSIKLRNRKSIKSINRKSRNRKSTFSI